MMYPVDTNCVLTLSMGLIRAADKLQSVLGFVSELGVMAVGPTGEGGA